MARLPIPGSDDGVWGDVLNDYLSVSHDNAGAIKPNAVDSSALQNNSVSGAKLQDGTVTNAKLNIAGGANGQVLTKNTSVSGGFEWTSAAGSPDATTSSKGLVQLAGDLGGTATAPTVPGLTTKANTSTTVSAGTGLTGGGDLSTNRTLSADFGTTAGTIAQGNDARITGAEQTANKGATNGYASLDGTTKVPIAQLPTGTTGTTVALGNDTRITGAVQATTVDAKGDILAATAADTITRLAVGTDGQVLTADSAQATGLRWATPSGGGGSSEDLQAARWGCKVITFTPHDLNPEDPQTLRMPEQRLYASWLPLAVGTLITGVRIPIQDNLTAAGSLWFTVYQDDGTQLGTTGDVSAAFTAGTGGTWRSAGLTVPAVTTGDGVWVTSLSTVPQASALSILFCDITTQAIPLWLFDGKARYTDGVATPPATYDPGTSLEYYDVLIGLY